MSTVAQPPFRARLAKGGAARREGLRLLGGMIALLWVIEVINTLDANRLDHDGIVPRDPARLWGILTSPLIHASFAHLIANSLPLLFTGTIIALRGARRLATLTLVIAVAGGFGTWLIAPPGTDTIGASGIVFGFSTYLIVRGAFTRRLFDLLTGAVVAVVLGGALTTSLVPHQGVSWQAHLCGGIAGVAAAWLLAERHGLRRPGARPGAGAATIRRRRAG